MRGSGRCRLRARRRGPRAAGREPSHHSPFAIPRPRLLPRRAFLASSALALAGCRLLPPLRPAPPQRVLIVGAGLAGLSCALDLMRGGHDVTVFEASGRAGGRVLTVRGFHEDQWAEAGAEFFTEAHTAVSSWVHELGLAVAPARRPRATWLGGHFADLDAPDSPASLAWGVWQGLPECAGGEPRGHLDRLSLRELLELDAVPEEVQRIVDIIAAPLLGAPAAEVSALAAVREAEAWHRSAWALRAGAEALPAAMAERLGDRVRLRCAVVRLAHRPDAVSIETNLGERFAGHHAVLAIPPPLVAEIECDPPLPEERLRAHTAIAMSPTLRTLLQFRHRVWETEHGSAGDAVTDLPIGHVRHATANMPGERGILAVQTTGPLVQTLRPLGERERLYRVVAQVDQIWPDLAPAFAAGASHDWGAQPWIRGGRTLWRPGQLGDLQPLLRRALGRVHFAGEHTESPPGTMEAALRSGRRVAWEIVQGL